MTETGVQDAILLESATILTNMGPKEDGHASELKTDIPEGSKVSPLPPSEMKEADEQYIGKYKIIRELGHGGQGRVLLAQDQNLKRMVALKTLLLHGPIKEAALTRFRNEARAVAQLRHKNIVHLFEVFEDDGQPYLAMEYVEGAPLLDVVRRGHVEREQIVEWVAQACEAMGHAHGLGVIHRDLKPQNVMITPQGEAKVMDFGLARSLRNDSGFTVATLDGQVMGSPAYMSPEQAMGDQAKIGPPADVYALGTMLYQCLSGVLPLGGDTPHEAMFRIVHEEPDALLVRDPTVPDDLSAICMKALEKNPEERYPTAAEMAADLRRYLGHEPVNARPATLTERVTKAVRRNQDLAVISGVALTIMAITITASLTLFARQSAASHAEHLQTELRSVAGASSLIFSEEQLAAVKLPEDRESDEFKQLVLQMNELRRRNPRIDNLRLLRSNGAQLLLIADADAYLAGSRSKTIPGTVWSVPENSTVWSGLKKAAADNAPARTEEGLQWAGYAPIIDKNGNTAAVLMLQTGAQRVKADLRPAMRTTLQVAALAVALFILFTVIAATRVLHRRRFIQLS